MFGIPCVQFGFDNCAFGKLCFSLVIRMEPFFITSSYSVLLSINMWNKVVLLQNSR